VACRAGLHILENSVAPVGKQTMNPELSSLQPILVTLSWLMLNITLFNTKVGDFIDQHKVNT